MARYAKVVMLFCILLSGCYMDFGTLFKEHLEEKFVTGNERAWEKIAIIPISGIIVQEESQAWGDEYTSVSEIREYLNQIRKDANVKAVILEINSPGGSAVASDAINKLIEQFKQEKKIPVIAFLGDIAASGGYYVTQSSDYIVSSPMCITGSIGVIAIIPILEGLLKDKLAIEVVTIKSGKFKDIGSPFRKMQKEEEEYLQRLLDQIYVEFKQTVARGRKMDRQKVDQIAEGKIYTGQEAKELGLVDSVGQLEDAVQVALEKAGLKQAKVIRYHKMKGIFSWAGATRESILERYASFFIKNSSRPLYLWLPDLE